MLSAVTRGSLKPLTRSASGTTVLRGDVDLCEFGVAGLATWVGGASVPLTTGVGRPLTRGFRGCARVLFAEKKGSFWGFLRFTACDPFGGLPAASLAGRGV